MHSAHGYLLHSFLILVAASAAFGVLVPMPRFALQEDRFTWLRIHPVTSAVYLGVATVIAVAYAMSGRADRPGPRFSRPVYLGFALVSTVGLLATKTRGAVLGTVVGLVVLAWLAAAARRRVELLIIAIIAVTAIVLAASSVIVAYVQRGESSAQLASLNSRTELWNLAWRYIEVRPLYGYGLGASHSLFLDSTGLGGGHNAVVNVVTDLGIVGGLVWLWLIIATTLTAYRSRRAPRAMAVERALLLGLMALLAVNGVSNGGLGDEANISSTLLFVLAAWSVILAREPADPLPYRAGHAVSG